MIKTHPTRNKSDSDPIVATIRTDTLSKPTRFDLEPLTTEQLQDLAVEIASELEKRRLKVSAAAVDPIQSAKSVLTKEPTLSIVVPPRTPEIVSAPTTPIYRGPTSDTPLKLSTKNLLTAQPCDAGKLTEEIIAQCLASASVRLLPPKAALPPGVKSRPRRIQTYASYQDWLLKFVEACDCTVIGMPSNDVGPDLTYFVNATTLVLAGLKTSCNGKSVPNHVATSNAQTTIPANVCDKVARSEQKLVAKTRWRKAFQILGIQTVVRLHIVLPFREPQRKTARYFFPGKVQTTVVVWPSPILDEPILSYNECVVDVSFDELGSWLPDAVITALRTKFT